MREAFSKEFSSITDASKQACKAALTQNHNGLQLSIAYALRAFTKEESNKCTTEQELAAIHWGILHFRLYIYENHFTIKTDISIFNDKFEFQTDTYEARVRRV